MRPFATFALCAIAAACASTPIPVPTTDPDPERARAALATLHVDNRTAHRLAIIYRLAGRSAGEVGIGSVDPGTAVEMAPVPAGEPLIITARRTDGTELVLPPRTFAIDSAWTWRIEQDARFVRRQPGGR